MQKEETTSVSGFLTFGKQRQGFDRLLATQRLAPIRLCSTRRNGDNEPSSASWPERLSVRQKLKSESQRRRLTRQCHIAETGNESIRFSRSTAAAKKQITAREQARRHNETEPKQDAI